MRKLTFCKIVYSSSPFLGKRIFIFHDVEEGGEDGGLGTGDGVLCLFDPLLDSGGDAGEAVEVGEVAVMESSSSKMSNMSLVMKY